MATRTTKKASAKPVKRTASGKRIGRPPGSKSKPKTNRNEAKVEAKAEAVPGPRTKSSTKTVADGRRKPDTYVAVENVFDQEPMTRNQVMAQSDTVSDRGRIDLSNVLNVYAAQYRENGLVNSDKFYPVVKYKNRDTAVAVVRRINRWRHYKNNNGTDHMRRLDVRDGERWEAFLLKDEGPYFVVRVGIYALEEPVL